MLPRMRTQLQTVAPPMRGLPVLHILLHVHAWKCAWYLPYTTCRSGYATGQVTPAPDIPPAVEQQWHRAQWILYRLRRAYLDGPPTAPVQALASAGALASLSASWQGSMPLRCCDPERP